LVIVWRRRPSSSFLVVVVLVVDPCRWSRVSHAAVLSAGWGSEAPRRLDGCCEGAASWAHAHALVEAERRPTEKMKPPTGTGEGDEDGRRRRATRMGDDDGR
jgi:hypothetical protein